MALGPWCARATPSERALCTALSAVLSADSRIRGTHGLFGLAGCRLASDERCHQRSSGCRLACDLTRIRRECREKAIPTSYEEAVEDRAWKVRGVSSHCGETTTVRSNPDEAGEIARIYHRLCPPPRVKSGTAVWWRQSCTLLHTPARLNRDERRIDPHGQGVASFSLFDFSENLQPLRTTTTCNNHHYLSHMDDQRCVRSAARRNQRATGERCPIRN